MGQEQSSSSEGEDSHIQDRGFCRHICLLSKEYDLHSFMDKLAYEIRIGEIPSMKGRVLIMLDLRKFNTKAEYLPSRILLGNMFSDLEDPTIISCFEWMIENQQKLVFIIYSLDTYPYELVWKRPLIGYYKPSSADVVIFNLLSRNLFPNSAIISTSGQKQFESIHPLCFPEYYIKLDGISDRSNFAHINELIGKSPLEKSKKLHKPVWPQGDQFDQALEAMGMRRSAIPGASNTGAKAKHSKISNQSMTSQNRDIDAKRRILSEHMIEALNNETNERKRLEHLLMVYEGREKSAHVIRSSVRAFDLSDVPFNDFDIKAVSFLISLAKNLDGINFSRCNLNVTSIETLADHILASPVKIDKIDLSRNEFQPRGMFFLAKIIKHCKSRSLRISEVGIRVQHLQKLLAGTSGCKVYELDISKNIMEGEAMFALGKLVKHWNVKYLDMNNCCTNLTHMKKFLDGSGGMMLEVLDLSDWTEHPPYCPQILDLVTRVRREISLHGWEILESDRALIQEKLDKTNSKVLVIKLNGGYELKARSAA